MIVSQNWRISPVLPHESWVAGEGSCPGLSDLNAHSSLADLSVAYREAATAAGLDLRPSRA